MTSSGTAFSRKLVGKKISQSQNKLSEPYILKQGQSQHVIVDFNYKNIRQQNLFIPNQHEIKSIKQTKTIWEHISRDGGLDLGASAAPADAKKTQVGLHQSPKKVQQQGKHRPRAHDMMSSVKSSTKVRTSLDVGKSPLGAAPKQPKPASLVSPNLHPVYTLNARQSVMKTLEENIFEKDRLVKQLSKMEAINRPPARPTREKEERWFRKTTQAFKDMFNQFEVKPEAGFMMKRSMKYSPNQKLDVPRKLKKEQVLLSNLEAQQKVSRTNHKVYRDEDYQQPKFVGLRNRYDSITKNKIYNPYQFPIPDVISADLISDMHDFIDFQSNDHGSLQGIYP